MTDTGGKIRSIWALVLAAGEGTRLHSLTSWRDGSIPKPFCSLRGGASLLHEALARAGMLRVPQYGWNNLGTLRRVARALRASLRRPEPAEADGAG